MYYIKRWDPYIYINYLIKINYLSIILIERKIEVVLDM